MAEVNKKMRQNSDEVFEVVRTKSDDLGVVVCGTKDFVCLHVEVEDGSVEGSACDASVKHGCIGGGKSLGCF